MIQTAIAALLRRSDLSGEEMSAAMGEIADGGATPAQIGAFLIALRMKGETVEEIAAAAQVMRSRVETVHVSHPVFIDTCGTGGDGRHTFNISTAAALVVCAAGVPVAKHGNRSVSSRCGSADVLAALGVDVDIPRERVETCIAEVGIGFLFAPRLHPAFGAAAVVRRELGVHTLFNLLGPLANPAGARRQVLGVFDPRWVGVLGSVLSRLGAERAFVVHGAGLDEIAVTGSTEVCEVFPGGQRSYRIEPEQLGLRRWKPAELDGGDAATNARIILHVLEGRSGAPRDAVIANAAAGLVAGAAAQDLQQGARLAALAIDSGAALGKLTALAAASRTSA